MMQQQVLFFVILLNCLLIPCEMVAYSFGTVNLKFDYIDVQSQRFRTLTVSAQLTSIYNVKSIWHLQRDRINNTTFVISRVQYFNDMSSRPNSQDFNLLLHPLLDRKDMVFRLRNANSAGIRNNLRVLFNKTSEKYKFNLTYIVPNTTNDFTGGPADRPLPFIPLSNLNFFGLIFLLVCLALITGFCSIWFCLIYCRHIKQQRTKKRLRKELAKTTQEMLDKTPVIIFDSENKDNDDDDDDKPTCAICLESFKNQDKLRKLDCTHCYHITCIDPWLISHQSCPLCNRNVLRNSIPTISSSVEAAVNEQNTNQV